MPNIGKLKSKSNKAEKIIFIDRDGVINEDPIGDYVKQWRDFHFIDGALEALRRLRHANFAIVVISNQAGIGDGIFTKEALKETTEYMLKELKKGGVEIRGIYYCLHGKEENCECRKPKTGLLEQAAREIKFKPKETFFIGDKVSDVQAGERFGLRTLFVLTGHGEKDRMRLNDAEYPERIFPSLKEAVDYILNPKS